MAFDEGLAQRVRELLEEMPGCGEKKLFGGVCFLMRGNMACGIIGDKLIVRIGPEGYEDSLKRPHIRKFDFTGRPMKGWIVVSDPGYDADADLASWVQRGVRYALSLPPK